MGQAFRREALNLPFSVWSMTAWVIFVLNGGNPFDPQADPAYAPPAGLSLGLFGLEILSTLGNRKRRALHDFIAGSVVIRHRASDKAPPDSEACDPEPRTPVSGEFTCPACGTPARFGSSLCHVCDEPFVYQDGRAAIR
jgi:hypothetical protein